MRSRVLHLGSGAIRELMLPESAKFYGWNCAELSSIGSGKSQVDGRGLGIAGGSSAAVKIGVAVSAHAMSTTSRA